MSKYEEYIQAVTESYEQFKKETLKNDAESVFDSAYTIAKISGLYDFLVGAYDEHVFQVEGHNISTYLFDHKETILWELCYFEQDYEVPQWGTWDDIENMLEYMIETNA